MNSLVALGIFAIFAAAYAVLMPPLTWRQEFRGSDIRFTKGPAWKLEEDTTEWQEQKTLRWWTWRGYVSYTSTLARGGFRDNEWGDEEVHFDSHPRLRLYRTIVYRPGVDGSWMETKWPIKGEDIDHPGRYMRILKTPPPKVLQALERGRRRFGKWQYWERLNFVNSRLGGHPKELAAIEHFKHMEQ